MLVLSRRERERICLGDSIVVTIVRVTGDTVRLGIEAPADMLVLRGELEARPTLAFAGEGVKLLVEIAETEPLAPAIPTSAVAGADSVVAPATPSAS